MLKKILTILLTIATISTSLIGCSNNTQPIDDNTEPQSTTSTEATTPTETTTEEPTTEEPTTKYVYKGEKFMCSSKEQMEYFDGLILQPGDKIYLNDLCGEDSVMGDTIRGDLVVNLLADLEKYDESLITKYDELIERKLQEGIDMLEIKFSENYCIEYNGPKLEFVHVDLFDFDIIPVE